MSTVLLLIILIGLLVCSYCFLGRDLVSPILLLIAPFIVAISLGLVFYKQWEFELQWKTVALFSGSILSFFVGNLLIYVYYRYRVTSAALVEKENLSAKNKFESLNLFLDWLREHISGKKSQIVIFSALCILQIVTYCLVFEHILYVVNSYQGEIMGDRTNVLGVYDQLTKFSDVDTSLPTILNLSTLFCETVGFPIVYLFASKIATVQGNSKLSAVFEPVSLLLLFNAILSACGPLLTGGKAGTIWFIFGSLIIAYIVVANAQEQRRSVLSWKKILRIAIILVALVILTLLLVFAVGRNMDGYNGPFGYLLIYLAGGIKNIDIFIATQHPDSSYWGIQTFKSIYQRMNIEIPDVGLQEYHHIGDVWFGNVYTTFADPYYDFGILGTFIAMFILGVFFEYLFLHTYTSMASIRGESSSLVKPFNPRTTVFSILVYGYLVRAVFFAFFSNFLFTSIFSFGFIIRCVIWLLFVLCFIPRRSNNQIVANGK